MTESATILNQRIYLMRKSNVRIQLVRFDFASIRTDSIDTTSSY